ncbi:MAG: endonuclease/exonuclease/phosphatase family protein [Xenococcus sp. (in: cyanobacteria)]
MLKTHFRRFVITLVIVVTFFLANANVIAIADTLKIATWNIENLRVGADKDYPALQEYAEDLDADIIALQEVDGEEAAQQVFDPEDYNFFFSSRNNRQRTGFAVKKEINVTQNPDFEDLNVSGGLRYGTDITVSTDTQPIRFLSIHLKSFCFANDLDNPNLSDDCEKLKLQLPILEDWIDARAEEEIPFAVLGDFNRRLNIAGDDFWVEIDDQDPVNSDLTKVTEDRTSQCFNGQYPDYIDHIVLDKLATEWFDPSSFEQELYGAPLSQQDSLSDHCAIAVTLNTSVPEPVTLEDILNRLDEIESELEELKDLIEDLD